MAVQTQEISSTDTQSLPLTLPLSLDHVPKLDYQQAGHLRHFYNLVKQKDGCWEHMGSEDPGQEMFDAYRYQIANMTYAASLAHYHHLPALQGLFKPLLRRLIHKMLRRDVWGYWYTTSSGGNLLDPSLSELRTPWADPVVRENIMYSGHLLLMTSLYAMLFDDDEFERPDSIVFDWDPRFWGLGSEQFKYSIASLQKIILSEMETNGWLGVCCEPNVVFVVCNQFPLIAIRYNDVRNNTEVCKDVLAKYSAAWERKGMVQPDGLLTWMWRKKQDSLLTSSDLSLTAWAGTFLHSWNADTVERLFDQQSRGFITTTDDEGVRLHPASIANRIRQLHGQISETHEPVMESTIKTAKEQVERSATPAEKARDKSPAFGYVAQWLSELGKSDLLSSLLEYADSRLNPSWHEGGLYYPRHDEQGLDWTYVDPYTGNSAIGYARLNVPNGQKIMFEQPWTRKLLESRPYMTAIDLSQGVDFLRGSWIEEHRALVVTVRSWDGRPHQIQPRANNLGKGSWGIYINGRLERLFHCATDGTSLVQKVEVGGDGKEVDLVLLHQDF